MTELKSPRTGDSIFVEDHASGLKIMVYPKPGYRSAYAVFGTRYGSVNTRFKADGELVSVPDGIAHFLEHKMFESEEGDAFAKYAKTGASANAFTSFDQTCYLFSCTENFEKSFEILLDLVQSPYFTEQTVQKEQGIIGQEIRMYDDSPDWRVMVNLLNALYHNHPVKIDIAGTVESIAEITAEKLYQCYRAYYNLHNMVLCVAGNVDPGEVVKIADRKLKPVEKVTAENVFPQEPDGIVQERVEQRLAVAVPMFQLGFKETRGYSGFPRRKWFRPPCCWRCWPPRLLRCMRSFWKRALSILHPLEANILRARAMPRWCLPENPGIRTRRPQ